jgi:antitoxin ParD1/3/4
LIVTISADLGSRLEKFVADLVTSGRYSSESEVLREAVLLIEEREARVAAVDEALMQGLASLDAGRVKPASEVFDRLEAKYRAMAEAKGS